MTAPTPPSSTGARTQRGREPGLAATLALYTLARLVVVALVAGLLTLAGVPFLLGVLIGLIVALPLSMVLFRGLRARLDRAIAVKTARRTAERDSLRAQLRGERPPAGEATDDRAPGSGAADAPDGGASDAPRPTGSDRPGDGEPDRGRG